MGRVEDRLGIRMNQNAEIIFEDCRIPKNHLVNELHGASAYRGAIAGGSKTKTATKALGVARAAFEEAVAYPRERVQEPSPSSSISRSPRNWSTWRPASTSTARTRSPAAGALRSWSVTRSPRSTSRLPAMPPKRSWVPRSPRAGTSPSSTYTH